jgi:HlyD family secretion protein
VQHLEGGIVGEILVRDGDAVTPGQVLLRLDGTRARAGLAIIESQRDVLLAREARLLAERDGTDAITFPDGLLARGHLADVAEIVDGQRRQLAARRASIDAQVALLRQQALQYGEEITGLEAQRDAKDGQLAILADELAGLHELHRKGFARRTRILELERMAEALRGDRGQHVADIARAETAIADSELRILQLHKGVQEQVVDELYQIQAQLLDLSERRTAAADELSRIDITAPRAGLVVGLGIHTIGGVIGPGQAILDVVPGEEELVIECQLRPQDVDKVAPGLAATVRLSAFDLRSTPELEGTVMRVSADRVVDEATGLPYYILRVRIPPDQLARLGALRLLPGMPAEVFVQTGERTALSYLLKPLSDGLARAFRD